MPNQTNIEIRKPFRWIYDSPALVNILVYCRGSGKSFAALDWLIFKLLNNPDPNATAVYYNKSLKQTRSIVELAMSRYKPLLLSGKFSYNKSTLTYTINDSKNSKKKLFLKSYEEKEASRGFHPYVGVFDEAQTMPQGLYGEVMVPMFGPALQSSPEHAGILVIGTPEGPDNILYELFQKGLDDNNEFYRSKLITVYTSELFNPSTIKALRMSMTEKEFAQEYECDFNANVITGAIYKELLDLYRYNNFGTYKHDPMYPVHMAWDLGYTHYTSVWFWQCINGETRIIDFYESTGQDISKCLFEVLAKPYQFGHCILPHDADHHNIRSPLTISQIFKNNNLRCTVLPPSSITAGIEATKLLLKSLKFDEEHTKQGILHLEKYAYKLVHDKGIDRSKPDQSSPHADAADALRMMAVSQSVWFPKPLSFNSNINYSPNVLS